MSPAGSLDPSFERVPEEQVVRMGTSADQSATQPARGKQQIILDQAAADSVVRPSSDERRDGEVKLVDQVGSEQ